MKLFAFQRRLRKPGHELRGGEKSNAEYIKRDSMKMVHKNEFPGENVRQLHSVKSIFRQKIVHKNEYREKNVRLLQSGKSIFRQKMVHTN